MAQIVGGIATSHIPSIGKAIARGLYDDPYWKEFFDGYKPVHQWLDQVRPDTAIVVYNDHGLNFFLDKMPTFAIGAAFEYRNADEGWGLPVVPPFPGHPELSWHMVESLVTDEFDMTTCQEMLVDHAFTVPMALLWPGNQRRLRTVPLSVNTVQLPLPSPARCFKLGQAIGRALASFPENEKVVIVSTGGLSHQLDGTRAGFINKRFDRLCIEKIVHDPWFLTRYSVADLIRESGAQGVELLMWIVMRGALAGHEPSECKPGRARRSTNVSKVHTSYHVPISNTAAAVMVLENNTQWSERWLDQSLSKRT